MRRRLARKCQIALRVENRPMVRKLRIDSHIIVIFLATMLILSPFLMLTPSVRADMTTLPIDLTGPTACQSLLAGSYTNPQSGLGQISANGRGSAVCSWSLPNLSGASHIRLSFEMNSSVPTPGPLGPRVTALVGLTTSAPTRIDADLSAIFPNRTETTTATVDCCYLPAFLSFDSDLWVNPDASSSGDRVNQIFQQQFSGYADDNTFHIYTIDFDLGSQTTTWSADGGTSTATYSGFTFNPGQFVFYARSTDDGNSMIAQIRNVTLSAVAPQPDFGISPSPTVVIVRSGAVNFAAKLVLQSLDGLSGTVSLSVTSPLVVVKLAQDSILLGSGQQLFVRMTISARPDLPLGDYSVTVTAQRADLTHQVSFTVRVVGSVKAVMNVVRFGTIGKLNATAPQNCPLSIYCFSVQQNFLVEAPNGTVVFEAQNVARLVPVNIEANQCFGILGCLHITIFSGWALRSSFNVFDRFHSSPILNACTENLLVPHLVHTPFAVNFTSVVLGNTLMMSNNATKTNTPTSLCHTANQAIPDGSFIVGYSSPFKGSEYFTHGVLHSDPEIVIVAGGTFCPSQPCRPPTVGFFSETSGHAYSYEQLIGSKTWEIPASTILHPGEALTGEWSANLQWTQINGAPDGGFNYSNGTADQGLALQSDYFQFAP